MKKAERVAKASAREANRQRYAREGAAMQAFLLECRTIVPLDVWKKEGFEEPQRWAGNTFHIVERMVLVLAAMQQPITPPIRLALDAMLDVLGLDRCTVRWEALRHLNYGAYWKSQYGY
ncbi:MAG TPA: hypothetical protein PLN21_14195 [Gemmatales bacterium]|nr:hypothetical protein [Gemmatales bacterium]